MVSLLILCLQCNLVALKILFASSISILYEYCFVPFDYMVCLKNIVPGSSALLTIISFRYFMDLL